MQPHQERVLAEKADLDDKAAKLLKFIDGDVYDTLPETDRELLEQQYLIMASYSAILGKRIARF
jgi:hypothetical protein